MVKVRTHYLLCYYISEITTRCPKKTSTRTTNWSVGCPFNCLIHILIEKITIINYSETRRKSFKIFGLDEETRRKTLSLIYYLQTPRLLMQFPECNTPPPPPVDARYGQGSSDRPMGHSVQSLQWVAICCDID